MNYSCFTSILVASIGSIVLQGCASLSAPYQHTNDDDHSLARNIVDSNSSRDINFREAEDGTQAPYYPGGGLGTLLAIGMAANGAIDPVQGLSPALSAAASYATFKPDESSIETKPLVFGFFPWNQGDDAHAGGRQFMAYLDHSLETMAVELGGRVEPVFSTVTDDHTLNTWKFVAPEHGCSIDNACVVRAYFTANTAEGLYPAEWVLDLARKDYESMALELGSPNYFEPESPATAWKLVNNGGSNYSQVQFLRENMEDDPSLLPLYKSLSNHLPRTFALYLPPDQRHGINLGYPVMLHDGEELLFEEP